MHEIPQQAAGSPPGPSNAEIAHQLLVLAQLLAAQGANPFKVKAYRRAAKTINSLGESIAEAARSATDLTVFPGIGEVISSAIREIVHTGALQQIQVVRSSVSPELAALSEYPRLDPKRVLRIYKKLGISSVEALKDKLASGEIVDRLGARMDQHVRQALAEVHEIMWYEAETNVSAVRKFLVSTCGVTRAEVMGEYRRGVEVVDEISFLVETNDLEGLIAKVKQYGGKADLLAAGPDFALFKLSSGTTLRIGVGSATKWGLAAIALTGSPGHLRKLEGSGGKLSNLGRSPEDYPTEADVYRRLGLDFIPPELREGHNEVALAAVGKLPALVDSGDIRGELHAHSTSSDGANTIEEMAFAAREKRYEYIGISDHSQSLKIARGLSEAELWDQIRCIDKLNETIEGIRVLKSAEVDILVDGSLDYPEELLKELDYTVCSIHSRFGLGKAEQTERILRAMDNRYFNILGHATGRLLLKRPGYEIDIDRVVEHARLNGCYFEINASPDRLDLSAENARRACEAGVKIAITTDAHSTRDFNFLRYGINQARRAGLQKESVLNHLAWADLQQVIRR